MTHLSASEVRTVLMGLAEHHPHGQSTTDLRMAAIGVMTDALCRTPDVPDVRAELERLRAQRDAVLALHPLREIGGQVACGHCTITGLRGGAAIQCAVTLWPCPTVRALGGVDA